MQTVHGSTCNLILQPPVKENPSGWCYLYTCCESPGALLLYLDRYIFSLLNTCTQSDGIEETVLSAAYWLHMHQMLLFTEGRGTTCVHPMWQITCCRTFNCCHLILLKQGNGISQLGH